MLSFGKILRFHLVLCEAIGSPLVSLDESPRLLKPKVLPWWALTRHTQGRPLVSFSPSKKNSSNSLRPWVRSSAKRKWRITKLIGKTFNQVKIKVSPHELRWEAPQSEREHHQVNCPDLQLGWNQTRDYQTLSHSLFHTNPSRKLKSRLTPSSLYNKHQRLKMVIVQGYNMHVNLWHSKLWQQ